MNAWPDDESLLIARYVRQLSVRTALTRRWYSMEIRAFQRFIQHTDPEGLPTEAAVVAWIRERSSQLRPIVIADRACKIHRFLEYLVQQRCLENNPFALLGERYGDRSIGPLVRALCAPDSEHALLALRKPAPWASSLGPVMADHVALRRSMGYRYRTEEARFRAFDRFLQRRPDLAGQPLSTLLQAWADTSSTLAHAGQCQLLGRLLSRVLHRLDPTAEVLPLDRGLRRRLFRQRRRPYIYSQEELGRLLNAARSLKAPRSPLLPLTAYTMLMLAYCGALRIGELVRLTIGDLDQEAGILTVRNTKFFKSRQVPLHPSASQALQVYLSARRRAGGLTAPSAALFWQEARSGGYSRAAAESLLTSVLRFAGLKPERGRVGPRIHDLRHAFVVHRMLEWYEQGIDPEPRLPHLATFLGHKSIHSTLIYITVTQELLQQAAERFRRHGAASLRGEGVSS